MDSRDSFMDRCFKCGASGEKTRLFDVISKEGIVKICGRCLVDENFPLIQKPTTFQLKDAEKEQTFKERVKQFHNPPIDSKNSEDVTLRDIVDKNLKIKYKEDTKPRPDLVDNFHWVIMRERRAKHISREQFAKDLGESETVIKMVEQGILPEDDNRIINKIEGYLNIHLRKAEFRETNVPKNLEFDRVSIANLTISDLREMKDQREEEIFAKPLDVWEGDIEEQPVNETKEEKREESSKEEEKELSQEDIDDLIFGR